MIATAVRWYCQLRLSLANVRDLLAERHLDVSARTILSWVHTFGPLFARAVRRHARPLGARWYCDETYVRVAGRWAYLYQAVDEAGRVAFLVASHDDGGSADVCTASPGKSPVAVPPHESTRTASQGVR